MIDSNVRPVVDPTVFTPFRINQLELRNRIFVPAHTTNFGADH